MVSASLEQPCPKDAGEAHNPNVKYSLPLRSLSDFTGSVLRLDVDIDMCSVPYSIPRSNPHFNSTNQPPEVFAHGLHNPGR